MTDKNDTVYFPPHPMYGASELAIKLAIPSPHGTCCPEMEIVDGVCVGCGRPYYLCSFPQIENIIRRMHDNFDARIQTLEVSLRSLETRCVQKTPVQMYPLYSRDWINAYTNATFLTQKNMELSLATSIYNNSKCTKYLDSGGRALW